MHHGVLGMKWGKRSSIPRQLGVRNSNGMVRDRVSLSKTKEKNMLESDLEKLKSGKGVSRRGFTKSRQEEMTKRDISRLEKKIADLDQNKINHGKEVVLTLLHDLSST